MTDVVRPADPERDAAACADIYAPYVDPGPASFEAEPPDAAEMAGRMRAAHRWLVCEAGRRVAGFAYAGSHRAREAYRFSVETSVYIAAEHTGAGLGRALYDVLLDDLRSRGFRMALAGITLPNPASVALHERCGFEPVGVFHAVGFKAGAWRDVGWWELDLAAGR